MAIHKIKRVRRNEAPPESTKFETYRSRYKAILEELYALDGDRAVDQLTDWIIDETRQTGELPTPEQVTARALKICEGMNIQVADDSILRE